MRSTARIIVLCVMGIYALLALPAVFTAALPARESAAYTRDADSYAAPTSQTEAGYIVRSVNGKIAVEDVSTGKIVRITETRVAILPASDRELLRKGIKVGDEYELRSVLEDLCS